MFFRDRQSNYLLQSRVNIKNFDKVVLGFIRSYGEYKEKYKEIEKKHKKKSEKTDEDIEKDPKLLEIDLAVKAEIIEYKCKVNYG